MLEKFLTTVELVPPAGPDPGKLLESIIPISGFGFTAFSIATNPVAKPKMSNLALAQIIREKTGKPSVMHLTTRDHNRIGFQSLLWGARALGITTVLAATGDSVGVEDRPFTSPCRDFDVFDLIRTCRESGLTTGAVFTPYPDNRRLEREAARLRAKVEAGAQFIVTQPIYDELIAERTATLAKEVNVPFILGILPLLTDRHAVFLHERVAGITIDKTIIDRMKQSDNQYETGMALAREMLAVSKSLFSGCCLMPPFNRFEMVSRLLEA